LVTLAAFEHMQTAFRLVEIAGLDVSLWLHTDKNPSKAEWDAACAQTAALGRRRGGDFSSLRTIIISDGGAPSSEQRTQFFGIFARPTKTSLITSALANPVKRAIANAIASWLNPAFRVYGPANGPAAFAYVDLVAQHEAVFRAFDELQSKLPPVETLALVRKAVEP
jgi:hypothetical protein